MARKYKSQIPNPKPQIPSSSHEPPRHRDSEENLYLCVSESRGPSLGLGILGFGAWGLGFAKATRGRVFQSERLCASGAEACRSMQNRNRYDENHPPVFGPIG